MLTLDDGIKDKPTKDNTGILIAIHQCQLEIFKMS